MKQCLVLLVHVDDTAPRYPELHLVLRYVEVVVLMQLVTEL